MAHVAKYQASALGGMCAHYDRTPEIERGFRRDNIDPERTGLNYNLAPDREGGQVAFVNARIDGLDLKRAPRRDAVRMCDCVVTMPGTLDPARRGEFFESVYGFLSDRYGADNVVSAWVHMDEASPHMHFAWVPVTEDGRLSAKDVVSRRDLKTLHGDMQACVERDLGCPVEILIDPERAGEKQLSRLSQDEYVAAKERRAQLVNEVADLEGDIVELDSAVEDRRIELHDLGEQIERETRRLESVRRSIAELEAKPAQETVAESFRALWEGRGAGSREEALAGEIEGLRGRISGLEDANRRARGRVGELDRGLPGLRARHRELGERFKAVERRVTEVIGRMREVPNVVSGLAQGIARRLGRAVFDPRSLSHMSREATRAARAQESSRSAHLPSRDIRGDIGAR